MACVKYDRGFANHMKAQFANHDNLVASAKNKKNSSITESNVNTKAKSRGPKKDKVSTPSTKTESELNASPAAEDPVPSPPAREQRQRKASRKVLESRA